MNISLSWFAAAMLGMFSFSCMALLLKKLTYEIATPVILFYLFSFCALFYGVYNTVRTGSTFLCLSALSLSALLLLFAAALFAFLGNFCDVEALRLAPNAGYAGAVKAGQILIITFAAPVLFADQRLTWSGMIGVALVFSGLILLAYQRS